MDEVCLSGLCILVVEDEYLIADEIRGMLNQVGVEVVGPVPTVDDALARIAEAPHIDGAILDINLRGTMVFAVADVLAQRDIPFLFATGYDGSVIPDRFAKALRAEKPLKLEHIVSALGSIRKQGNGFKTIDV